MTAAADANRPVRTPTARSDERVRITYTAPSNKAKRPMNFTYAPTGTRGGGDGSCAPCAAAAAIPSACTPPLSHRKLIHDNDAPSARPAAPRHPQRHAAQTVPANPSNNVSRSIRTSTASPNISLGTVLPLAGHPPYHLEYPRAKSQRAQDQRKHRRRAQPSIRKVPRARTDQDGAYQHKWQIKGIGDLPE
jgi:hypothetical protein